MLKLAYTAQEGHIYVSLDHPREVDNFSLKGLGYFRKALGMSDYRGSFKSWITRPGPVLLGCVAENELAGWCMFENWDRNDKDGTPISVLRTIEVRPDDRGKKIGLNLVALMSHIVPGHIATRPLGPKAKQFFEKLGFITPPGQAQVAFEQRSGYLLLTSAAKRGFIQTLNHKELLLEAQNMEKCSRRLKTQVLREEISRHSGFGQAFLAALSMNGSETETEKVFIKSDTARIPCACGSTSISFFTLAASEAGESEHLTVECNKCSDVWVTVPI